MDISNIKYDNRPLKESAQLKSAVAYLTNKFKGMSNEQVKSWINKNGTFLKPGQQEWVRKDALTMNLTDSSLIWNIEVTLDLFKNQL